MRITLIFLLVRLLQGAGDAAEQHADEGVEVAATPVQQAKLRRESTMPPPPLDSPAISGLPTIPELQVGVSALGAIDNTDPLALSSALSAAPSIDDVLAGRLGATGLSAGLPQPASGLDEMVSELRQQVAQAAPHKVKPSSAKLGTQESAHAAVDHLAKMIYAEPDPGLVSQLSQTWLTEVGQVEEVKVAGGSELRMKQMVGQLTPQQEGLVNYSGGPEQEQMKQQLKEVALHGKLDEGKRLESEGLPGYRWNSNTNAWEADHEDIRLGPSHGLLAARQTFEEFDRNGDGVISRQEYHEDVVPPQELPPARDAFEAFDKNRDGLISWNEYHQEPSRMAPIEPHYYVKAPGAASDLEALLVLCHRCQDQERLLDSAAEQQLKSRCQQVRSQCAAQHQTIEAAYHGHTANSSTNDSNSAANGPADLAEAQQVVEKTLAMEAEILHRTGMSDVLEVNESVDEEVDESKVEVTGLVVLVGGVIMTVAGVALGMEISQVLGKSKQQQKDEEAAVVAQPVDEQEDWQNEQAEEVECAAEVGHEWGQPGQ